MSVHKLQLFITRKYYYLLFSLSPYPLLCPVSLSFSFISLHFIPFYPSISYPFTSSHFALLFHIPSLHAILTFSFISLHFMPFLPFSLISLHLMPFYTSLSYPFTSSFFILLFHIPSRHAILPFSIISLHFIPFFPSLLPIFPSTSPSFSHQFPFQQNLPFTLICLASFPPFRCCLPFTLNLIQITN